MISRRDAWTVYLLLACQGFLFYGVGYLTPYVETALGAPAWASVLPNSVMAVGLLVASVAVPPAVHRLGPWGAARAWALLMVAGASLIALGGSLAPILAGGFLLGIAGAGALTHAVNAFAGYRNGVLLVRATLASVIGGVLGPLVLSAAARTVGWNLGILAPVPLALVLAILVPARRDRDPAHAVESEPGTAGGMRDSGRPAEPRLGRGYWLAWTFLVLCIGAESSFVAWGAQVAVARAGLSLADATALGSLFVAGLIVGRLALGAGRGPAAGPTRLLAAMTVAGLAGGGMVWIGASPALAGAGLFLGGLGIAGIWPTAAAVAVANAPRAPVTAGARLNLASGAAVLVVPFVLGVTATLGGVIAAWAIVLGLLVMALAVLPMVPAVRR